jgi:hypothetical protein
VLRESHYTPHVLITVCDGCNGDRNDRCEISLRPQSYGRAMAGINSGKRKKRLFWPMGKWLITDHFSHAIIPDNLPVGAEVTGPDQGRKEFRYRKVALLSSDWGGYGSWSSIGGATLFSIITD